MSQPEQTAPPTFSWQAFPAGQRRGHAALALAVIAAVGVLTYGLLRYGGVGSASGGLTDGQCVLWAVLTAAVLFLSLHRFFFPSHYEIDSEGMTYRHLLGRQRYRWDQFHRFLVDERGGFLATTAYRPRLRPLQGVHVLFDGAREEAIRLIRQHVGKGGEA